METAGLIKGLLNTPPNRSHGSFFGCWITLTDHQLEVYDVFFLPTSSLAIETSILGWSKFPMLKCCGIIWRGCSPSKQKKACFGLLQSIKLQFGVQKFLGEWIYRKRVCSQVLFFGCFTQMWDLEISYCSMGLVSLPTLKSYFFSAKGWVNIPVLRSIWKFCVVAKKAWQCRQLFTKQTSWQLCCYRC